MRCIALIGGLLLSSSAAQAALISGFESGLSGWDYLGDVSIQDASIGTNPTQGQQMAFVSTMCDRQNPPIQVVPNGPACETTTREHPYSGVSSPAAHFAREFLGMPSGGRDFLAAMPSIPPTADYGVVGESGAVKTSFYAPQAGLLEFDWNKIGPDVLDTAYFSLWSTDPTSSFRTSDWLYYGYEFPLLPSDVQVCTRYYDTNPLERCDGSFNQETGWRTGSVLIPTAGWYEVGFALGEIAEGTVPSVLALDNVRFKKVPEPGTLSLLAAGLIAIGARRRRRNASFIPTDR